MTPATRIRAYQNVIKNVLNNPLFPFMCNYLEGHGEIGYFCEFWLFKPESYETYTGNVWLKDDEKGNAARVNILLLCIEIAKDAKQPDNE